MNKKQKRLLYCLILLSGILFPMYSILGSADFSGSGSEEIVIEPFYTYKLHGTFKKGDTIKVSWEIIEGDEINVHFLDNYNYERYLDSENADVILQWISTTKDSFEYEIFEDGRYHVIFDNSIDWYDSKTVKIEYSTSVKDTSISGYNPLILFSCILLGIIIIFMKKHTTKLNF